jgi:hypothetical protein
LRVVHLPSVNHSSAGFAHAESMRRLECNHTVTSRGAAAGPDRSSTGNAGPEIILKPTRLFSKATRVLVTAMEEA